MPAGYRSETVSHEGEEIVYMLEGELTIRVEADEIVLDPATASISRQPAARLVEHRRRYRRASCWTGTVALFRPRRADAARKGRRTARPARTPSIRRTKPLKPAKATGTRRRQEH